MSNLSAYEIILNGKYDLQEVTEELWVEESIDEIALRITPTFVVTPDFPVLAEGNDISIYGTPYGDTKSKLLYNGVVWSTNSTKRGIKHFSVDIYDRTIYLKKSEDEYLFSSGQTASSRFRQYASDWGIPLGSVADTGVSLAKAIYRAQPIYKMIDSDLKETVNKGGTIFIPRMNVNKLELVQIAPNRDVWILEAVEEVGHKRTLENAVTKVKVLGKEQEGIRSSVLATVSKDTNKYGTLQKVIQDSKITKKSEAEKAANKLLSGVEESFSVRGIDINSIRAGDAVKLDGKELIVISIKHKLGTPGSMSLELGSVDFIRRKFYG